MVACGLVAHTLPSQCFSIDALSFKVILMGKAQQDTKDYIGFLQECPLLQGKLSPEAMQELSGSLEEVVRKANSNIICEGDEGNSFFIIRDGEVKCTKVGHAEEVSKRLTRGDFFGELALLSADKRAATVTVTEKLAVLSIDRSSFTRLLGNLQPPEYQ